MPGSASPGLDRGSGQQPLFTKTKWWTGLVADGGKDDNVPHLEARPGDPPRRLQALSAARSWSSRANSSLRLAGRLILPSRLAPVFWCRAAPLTWARHDHSSSSRVSPAAAAAAGKQQPYVRWRGSQLVAPPSGRKSKLWLSLRKQECPIMLLPGEYLAENLPLHKNVIEMLST